MQTMDSDRDSLISQVEGKEKLEVVTGRRFNGILGDQKDGNASVDVLWERWVASDGWYWSRIYASTTNSL